ncbi:thiamine biosynthesis lipoprotein [Sphingobium xanthum]|nr:MULTISPECIES: FAD:protein FMN transferase [Sphingobium]MCW2363969.1 thiamine biosynthesis lipoprotein [Sphingobium sp. B10D3B]MCW2402634.1 thiamine biosynthesis lipoprotein [Sphingobium sp. B10D7B]MCW2409613.1 thiamine biosynthesis lipoprotein [Sphingobium xanthum]
MLGAVPRIVVPPIQSGALAGIDPGAPVREIGGETMGTIWRARFCAPPDVDAEGLKQDVQARLDAIVADMSHWAPDSALSCFGAAPAGQWATLSADFAAVMATGLALAERTDGAFDPAIGRLTDLYGLGPIPMQSEPTDEALSQALARSGWRRLAFEPTTRRLRQPGGLWLDLSGIAKGYAVDAVADLLAERGVAHCLVEVGGELVGRGMRPDGDPWWVDLEIPPSMRARPIRIALHQLAVATSGNYVRGAHTLDPRTGRRVENGVASVSVLHARAMDADAWASALTVLGLHAGAALAIREGLAVHMLAQDGATTREWISPALAEMLGD